jgi:hypothetical protein
VAAAAGDHLDRPAGSGVMPLASSTTPTRAARLPPSLAVLDFRNGSKADISACQRHVRFTPESGHCPADRDVRFGPQADIMRCSYRSQLLGHALLNFLPVVAAGCKAPAYSRHILLLARSVLPHPSRGR